MQTLMKKERRENRLPIGKMDLEMPFGFGKFLRNTYELTLRHWNDCTFVVLQSMPRNLVPKADRGMPSFWNSAGMKARYRCCQECVRQRNGHACLEIVLLTTLNVLIGHNMLFLSLENCHSIEMLFCFGSSMDLLFDQSVEDPEDVLFYCFGSSSIWS